ncbi:MAG: hypothetical protein WC669_01340 [Patescibacteria group bacterium]|jgi:hypothetical protein
MHHQGKVEQNGTLKVNVPGHGDVEVSKDYLTEGGRTVQVPERLLSEGGKGYRNVPYVAPPRHKR